MDAAIGGVANQGGAMLRLLAQAGQRLIGAAVVAIKPKHQRIWSGHRILVVSKPEPDGNPVRSKWIMLERQQTVVGQRQTRTEAASAAKAIVFNYVRLRTHAQPARRIWQNRSHRSG
jgi:hypothetical protein